MRLTTGNIGDVRVVHVNEARIDAAAALAFKDAMRDACAGAPGRILLDLSAVDFIDSSGLGAIVASMKGLDAHQRLELAALTPLVDTVFQLTRMDTIFAIHPSLDEGLDRDAA